MGAKVLLLLAVALRSHGEKTWIAYVLVGGVVVVVLAWRLFQRLR
jgi:hypothetical protein